jgi:hypothetical protein
VKQFHAILYPRSQYPTEMRKAMMSKSGRFPVFYDPREDIVSIVAKAQRRITKFEQWNRALQLPIGHTGLTMNQLVSSFCLLVIITDRKYSTSAESSF